VILYLDTSSLARIYVSEHGSDEVRGLVAGAAVVATSRVAYPELRAALARRRRERTLRPAAFKAAKDAFEADWTRYVVVDVTSAICRDAGDFAERYGLRGFDSLHLASFASVVSGAGGMDKVLELRRSPQSSQQGVSPRLGTSPVDLMMSSNSSVCGSMATSCSQEVGVERCQGLSPPPGHVPARRFPYVIEDINRILLTVESVLGDKETD